MAKRNNAAEKPLIGRGQRPKFLNMLKQCSALKLQSLNSGKATINVWAYRTDNGWTGWNKKFQKTQVLPTNWSKDLWKEVK